VGLNLRSYLHFIHFPYYPFLFPNTICFFFFLLCQFGNILEFGGAVLIEQFISLCWVKRYRDLGVHMRQTLSS
jgi:hypothetical protein